MMFVLIWLFLGVMSIATMYIMLGKNGLDALVEAHIPGKKAPFLLITLILGPIPLFIMLMPGDN